MIEVLEDHRRVIEHRAVLDDQRGNFTEWILRAKGIGCVGRIGLLDTDLILETENADRKLDLAADWRRWRGTQAHHFRHPSATALLARQYMTEESKSAGDNQVHGLGAFTLLVRLHVERETLTFVQRFHAGALDGRDVHEHIAPAVVRLDKSVAPLAVEELDHSTLRHREPPFPNCPAAGPHGATARPDIPWERRRHPDVISAGPPREAERQSQHARVDNNRNPLERGVTGASVSL